MRSDRRKPKAMTADEWNAKHPVGTPVLVRPIISDPPAYKSRTRSEAWLLGHGDATVLIEGKSGGYFVGALDVVTEEAWAASPLPEAANA